MIDRLRKELNNFGDYNPGMATGGMVPHDDEKQDVDMIKTVLQKIIDEMTDMESQRMLPDGHPSKHVEIAAKVSPEESPAEESSESPDQESSEHDDGTLNDLLGKASSADETGALPEDHEEDLPPEIAALVAEKKKKLQ